MFSLLKSKEAPAAVPTAPRSAFADLEGMTLPQVLAAMLTLLAGESSNHYRLGRLYNYVVAKKLAEKAGFKDARDYFSKHLVDLSQAVLSRYGAVAEAFSEPVTRRFGSTCLSVLLTYKEAADLELNHEQPGDTVIEVPGQDGRVERKAFSSCSVEELRRALRLKRKPASSKPLPTEAVSLAEQYQGAVEGFLPQGTRVKVAARNQKGKAVLDFKGIPVEQVARLLEVLTGLAQPAGEPQPASEPQPVEQAAPRA